MCSFKSWMLLAEGVDPVNPRYREFVRTIPVVRQFLDRVDNANRIQNYKVGKTATYVKSVTNTNFLYTESKQYRVPVVVVELHPTAIVLQRTDKGDWSFLLPLFPILNKERTRATLPRASTFLVDDRPYSAYLDWFTRMLQGSGITGRRAASRFFGELFHKYGDSLDEMIPNAQVLSRIRSGEFRVDQLADESQPASRLKRMVSRHGSRRAGPTGRPVITFPDGVQWISLDRGYCELEGKAAGHCGNAAHRRGDNILSLRDPSGRILLTFVINDGVLSERKAPGNKKPQAYTHPYILRLLEDPMVREIGVSRFMPEADFQVTDLSPHDLKRLLRKRPDLVKASAVEKIYVRKGERRLKSALEERYGVPIRNWIEYRPELQSVVVGSLPANRFDKTYNQEWAMHLQNQLIGIRRMPREYNITRMMEVFWQPRDFVPAMNDRHKKLLCRYLASKEKFYDGHGTRFTEQDRRRLLDYVAGKVKEIDWDYVENILIWAIIRDANLRYALNSIYFDCMWSTIKILNNANLRGECVGLPYYVQLNDNSFKSSDFLYIDVLSPSAEVVDSLKRGRDFSEVPGDAFLMTGKYGREKSSLSVRDVVDISPDMLDPDVFYHSVDENFRYLVNPITNPARAKYGHWTDDLG